MSIPHVKREVLSEFVQPINDTKVSVQKKAEADLKAGMVLSEY